MTGKGFLLRTQIHTSIMTLKEEEPDTSNLSWKIKMLRANIPPEFWRMNIGNFKGSNHTAKNMVGRYIKKLNTVRKKGFGFLFTGPHGVGKTSLQMIILKAALREGYTAFHIGLPEIFRQIYLGFEFPLILVELNNILRNTEFLAIGEIGKDYHRKGASLFALSEFDTIFRTRRAACLPTNIDTNLDIGELGDTYGESLMSLFASRLKILRMAGTDYRKKIQQKEWRKHI